ncbi:hypothetical protein [Plantibacter sp. VKM Ac-2876]|uniref:hypothetical protein n=1 Tax=Plantibacter sp. VKM Ac-2876 TaxID=2783826 RepID=UPI00188A3B93|nr:hypothetical protein [Plantibacter sp. VKM Ac-2876]MBF4566084.1 hypothetical protein [Plantibacter sp. VKM Ac-2876]
MPSSSARQPRSASPIFTTLTHGFDAQAASSAPEQIRSTGTPIQHGSPLASADCPIFDQLAGRRLARRRSNVAHPA